MTATPVTAIRWTEGIDTHVRVDLGYTRRHYRGDRYAGFSAVIVTQEQEGGVFGVHGFRTHLVDATLEVGRMLTPRVWQERRKVDRKGARKIRRKNLDWPMKDGEFRPGVVAAFVVPIVDVAAPTP